MKQLSIALSIFMLLSAGSIIDSHEAFAEDSGYWGTTSGKVWRSGFGGCWRSSNWTPEMADEDCGSVTEEAPVEEDTAYYWADDQDRDGVNDADDRCPFTPEGVAVDSNGCANDNDGDGVPDYLDQCPETPLGTVVDTNGCARTLVTLSGIHFEFDSARLTSEARSILDRASPSIQANPSTNISVEGHTDSTGSDSYNLDLSQRRAKSVVDYLISHGVSSSRLDPVGKGESYPITSNDTREGRHQNRRVEVIAR